MKKIILLPVFCSGILFSPLSQAQTFGWAKNMGGLGQDKANKIVADAAGNTYTVGEFEGSSDFNPGAATVNLSSAGYKDVYIVKLNPAGDYVWAVKFGGTDYEYVYDVTLDAAGNILLCGSFAGTCDFDPDPTNNVDIAAVGAFPNTSPYVVKVDNTGDLLWVKTFGASSVPNYTNAYGITTDASNNVYITGSFTGTIDTDPGAANVPLTSAGLSDAFLLKLDAAGTYQWAEKTGDTDYNEYYDVKLDNLGNILISGFSGYKATITKYHSSGTITWYKEVGNGSGAAAFGIAIDDMNNVYTTGTYINGDFDPHPIDTYTLPSGGSFFNFFVMKLNSSGALEWAHGFGDPLYEDLAKAITLDSDNNVYITGSFRGTADFDPSPTDSVGLSSTGTPDVFFLKLDEAGEFVWTYQLVDAYGTDYGMGVTADANDNIYFCGGFYYQAMFGSTMLSSPGGFSSPNGETFVCKINGSGTSGVNEVSSNGEMFTMYPNPGNGNFNILCQEPAGKTVFIRNQVGQTITTLNLNTTITPVDLSLPAGTYFVQAVSEKEVNFTQKLVITN